jgi:general secretion pathway protein G
VLTSADYDGTHPTDNGSDGLLDVALFTPPCAALSDCPMTRYPNACPSHLHLHLRLRARQSLQRGFTLIELMVVLVIIGVLGALIVPSLLDRADDARVTAAKTDINNVMQALKLYKLDNQRYPSAEQGLEALVKKPTVGVIPPNWKPYVDKLPTDPWGKPYGYLNPGLKGEIDVFSLGADGQQGGEGKNADIGSWQ